MRRGLLLALAVALANGSAEVKGAGLCQELVTTLYFSWGAAGRPQPEPRLEIRYCPGNLQFVAWTRPGQGPALVVDSRETHLDRMVLAGKVFVAFLSGASNYLVKVLVVEEGAARLAFEDATRGEVQVEVDAQKLVLTIEEQGGVRRSREFPTGEPVHVEQRLGSLPDYRDLTTKSGLEMLVEKALADEPPERPKPCAELLTTIYPHWLWYLRRRGDQARIEIRRCTEKEGAAALQLLGWTEAGVAPVAGSLIHGRIVRMVMAGNVFVLVTAAGSSRLVHLFEYRRGSLRVRFSGTDPWDSVVTRVAPSHVALTVRAEGGVNPPVLRFATGDLY